jgi:hypothetical protein
MEKEKDLIGDVVKLSPYGDNAVIEEQDKLVEAMIVTWNLILTEYENKTILFALKIKEILKGCPEKTIKEVVEKFRNHPNLKSPAHSKDRIMQGLRLVNERPDLVNASKLNQEELKKIPFDKRPYRKFDGTIFWEFYFMLYKYQIDPGLRAELEDNGKKDLWSVRQLQQEIGKILEEYRDPHKMRRHQKGELIRELIIMLRCLEPQDLIMLKDVIGKEYDLKLENYKLWLKAKDSKED